ncbi:MAG: hypothetical protein PHD82_04735 [Candidatus Riflebacteria bacterium]|nr:hypothetical protein [Candidatus Riflebacteria bacterium]
MHKRILVSGLLIGAMLGTPVFAQPVEETAAASMSVELPGDGQEKTREDIEPVDSFKLVVDTQEYKIEPGVPVELSLKGEKVKAVLNIEPLKTFNYGGVELQYPRYFTFEADLSDKDVKLWNLSGNQCVLMIQRYPVPGMDHLIMAQMLQPRFGEKNSIMSPCSMKLLGEEAKGTRLTTTIGDSTITQDIYSFKSGSGSLLLILQDTLGLNSAPSEEGKNFKEMLSQTFKLAAEG